MKTKIYVYYSDLEWRLRIVAPGSVVSLLVWTFDYRLGKVEIFEPIYPYDYLPLIGTDTI